MKMAEIINLIVILLVIVGAINWGLVAINEFDLVAYITPDYPQIERLIKLLVGIAGIYFAYITYMAKMPKKEEKTAAPVAAAKAVVA